MKATDMNASPRGHVMLFPIQLSRRRILPVPVLIALCWLLLQKGCVWNPDISPAHAIVHTDTAVTHFALAHDRISAVPPFSSGHHESAPGAQALFVAAVHGEISRHESPVQPVPAIDHTAFAFARWRATGGLIDHHE